MVELDRRSHAGRLTKGVADPLFVEHTVDVFGYMSIYAALQGAGIVFKRRFFRFSPGVNRAFTWLGKKVKRQ